MENRRIVAMAVALLAAFVLLSPTALAYDNVGAHRAINTAALVGFKNIVMPSDPYLKNAQLDLLEFRYGYAWDPLDGRDTSINFKYSQAVSAYRSKPLGLWLVDGGFSGDEPETPMAVRHFYDPVNEPRYLTDQMGAVSDDPKMNSISWVLDSNENQYSFYHGKLYFRYALASDNPERDGYYGCAWRSAGETMHVISDLTVPAHVRNDGHAVSESLEAATGVFSVLRYAPGTPARLDYRTAPDTRSLRNIMESVARWTNENFFSSDTIPLADGSQANGEKGYALPRVTGEPDNEGYFSTKYDGQPIKAYCRAPSSLLGFGRERFVVSGDAIADQQQRLIPTAIRASEAVLDAFLPRFTVAVDGVQASADARVPGYVVDAHIEHKATREWPAGSFPDGSIRNGAYIRVYHASGTADNYVVPLEANNPSTSLNRISTVVPAQPGDQVVVYYDFGGYKVFSGAYAITGTAPTAAPTASPSYPMEYEGGYKDVDKIVATFSGGSTESLRLVLPEDPLRPGQSFRLSVYQSFAPDKSLSPRQLPADNLERLNELYYHRAASLSIDTGGLATQDYSQNVEAENDYVAGPLTFTVKNTALPGSYTVTVTAADEYGKTRTATFGIKVA